MLIGLSRIVVEVWLSSVPRQQPDLSTFQRLCWNPYGGWLFRLARFRPKTPGNPRWSQRRSQVLIKSRCNSLQKLRVRRGWGSSGWKKQLKGPNLGEQIVKGDIPNKNDKLLVIKVVVLSFFPTRFSLRFEIALFSFMGNDCARFILCQAMIVQDDASNSALLR